MSAGLNSRLDDFGLMSIVADMDRETLEFYERTAAETAARYRAADVASSRKLYAEIFPRGGRILDVGAGSGRDVALLLEMGYDAWGLEPAERMRAEAMREFPQLEKRILPLGLPLPENAEVGDLFDGVVTWENMRQRHERRFDHELLNFLGKKQSAAWQTTAFMRLVEAVETTAIQRRAERWAP